MRRGKGVSGVRFRNPLDHVRVSGIGFRNSHFALYRAMAKLSEVIPALADALGLPETTVEAYAKVLRKAGLLTTGGRGTAAPDQTPHDCARLLVSVLGWTPTNAVEFVTEYGGLLASDLTAPRDHLLHFSSLLRLDFPHTLIDGVAALIAMHADNSIEDIAKKNNFTQFNNDNLSEGKFISLIVHVPDQRARISIGCDVNFDDDHFETIDFVYVPSEYWRFKAALDRHDAAERDRLSEIMKEKSRNNSLHDLKTDRKISGHTFYRLGNALKTK